ncbi:fatty acid desaturase [Actinoplanes octamycinicus]|uniref:Fatty acid desaturase n=1 Tax=Actinoplanes octamycinicus TaxID=135948 RepID=A0A7W7H1D2_9ACTN|nr:hypothetical protein [Actinoplanes octamycinicus]MBB4741937.1 fatty acid desaturase [Actinoplanes octamycinicus]GIE60702.1 hypothetical protein Aoc01nite_61040 [Actinoplanes octamycinicus]
MHAPAPDLRPLWLTVILLAASGVALVAGVLSYLGGMTVPAAVLAGGGAFSATTFLLIAIRQFLSA